MSWRGGEKVTVINWWASKAGWVGFSADLRAISPAQNLPPGRSTRGQWCGVPQPSPTHLAVQPQEAVREGVQDLEPLSGSHFSLSILKSFLGKSVPLAMWGMQPTARGHAAPPLPTNSYVQGVEHRLMERGCLTNMHWRMQSHRETGMQRDLTNDPWLLWTVNAWRNWPRNIDFGFEIKLHTYRPRARRGALTHGISPCHPFSYLTEASPGYSLFLWGLGKVWYLSLTTFEKFTSSLPILPRLYADAFSGSRGYILYVTAALT